MFIIDRSKLAVVWLPSLAILAAAFGLVGAVRAQSPLQLTPAVPVGADVAGVLPPSPDGKWVFYLLRDDDCVGLFRVAIGGGPQTRLSGPTPPDPCEISTLGFSADGQRLVFVRYLPADTVELFSVPVAGDETQRVSLLPSLAPGQHADDAEIVGNRLLLSLNGGGPEDELFLVPLEGPASAAWKINSSGSRRWSVDHASQRVVFLDGGGLYSVGLAATDAPVRLDSGGANRAVESFRLAPDTGLVALTVDADTNDADSRLDLQVANVTGIAGNATLIYDTSVEIASVGGHPSAFQIAPGGGHVAFLVGSTPMSGLQRLHAAPTSGAGPVQQLDIATTSTQGFSFTPEGSRIRFRNYANNAPPFRLHDAPASGSWQETTVHGPSDEEVIDFEAVDENTVLVLADGGSWSGDPNPIRQIYRLTLGAGVVAPKRISGLGTSTLVDVTSFGERFEDRWIYRGRLLGSTEVQLITVSVLGDPVRTAQRLNLDPTQAAVQNVQPARGGRWVVFEDAPDLDGSPQAFMARSDGLGDTLPLHPGLPPWFEVGNVAVTPDGTRLLFSMGATTVSPTGAVVFLQRIPEIFADGFEAGDLDAWNP